MSRWTDDQLTAIQKRGCSLLVSAAAGAGKTAVLVERIIRLILDPSGPADVDRLLVVTFTNAAAREMRERIGAELTKRYRENPQDRHVRRQLLLLGRAQISTIHSFCLDLIRKNCHQLKLPGGIVLDPGFRVADDVETMLLKTEVLETLFEERYAQEDHLFLQLVEQYGGERDDRALKDTVLRLYEFSRSHCHPEAWLQKAARRFQAGIEDEAVYGLFEQAALSMEIPVETALHKISAALEQAARPGGPSVYLPSLQAEKEMLESLLFLIREVGRGKDWRQVWQGLGEVGFQRLSPLRNSEVDEQIKELVQGLRNEAKKSIQQTQKALLSRTPEEYVRDMEESAALIGHLCRLAEDFSDQYLLAKLERNIIDFSDIEHFTIRLLQVEKEDGCSFEPSPLAEKTRERFEEIMIDEYQDINNVQEMILNLTARKEEGRSNLFMVGDVKQSIYGFRLAEPGLFLERLNRCRRMDSGQGEENVNLSCNFRSRESVVNGVNYVFRQLMLGQPGQVDYDAEAELVYAAAYPGGGGDTFDGTPLEVHLINREDVEDQGEGEKTTPEHAEVSPDGAAEEEDLDALQMEARVIGRRIAHLLNRRVWDKDQKEYRKARYSDMVVLLRSAREAAPVVAAELQRMGIPTYLETGTGYLAAQEVQTMLSLLRIIDNPGQDIPLAAVLRSPIMGLSAADLATIRLYRPGDNFYNAVRLAARREQGELGEKLRRFLSDLRGWRTFSRRNPLPDLIWQLCRDTGYYDYVGAMRNGEQRQANLRSLYDRARQFENTTLRGLFKFLRFLEKIEESGSDLDVAPLLGEKADVVRVMSIHKSKGLEFPVVFLAGLGKKFNMSDLNRDILLHKELGLGPVRVDPSLRIKYPTLARIAVRNKLKGEQLAEEMRILYVAMTRAREHLVLVGCVRDLSQKAGRLVTVIRDVIQDKERALPAGVICSAHSYWDWLLPVFVRHSNGTFIRMLAGLGGDTESEGAFPDDKSTWEISLWKPENLKEGKAEAAGSRHDGMPGHQDGLPEAASFLRALKPFPAGEAKPFPAGETGDLPGKDGPGDEEWVAARLGWRYPYEQLTKIPAKLSVTEIKNRYQGNRQDEMSNRLYERRAFMDRPLFLLQDKGLSAAEKGSALHLVMRHLALSGGLTEQDIRRQAKEMADQEIITLQQYESIPCAGIAAFLRSPLGKRLLKSPEVAREVPFTLAIPYAEFSGEEIRPVSGEDICSYPGEGEGNCSCPEEAEKNCIYPEEGEVRCSSPEDGKKKYPYPEEKVVVQGTIDCVFREGNGYVIIDYKTDRVDAQDAETLKNRYRIQMELYARAVETCLGLPVLEKIIYSFYLNEAVVL